MASADRSSIPHQNQQPKCPRCHSSNTKFCYYNNYSLSQPRHLCKSCKRYWTRGGTLRNVPVGGGCRKNKRSSSIKRTITNVDDRPKPNLDQSTPSNNNLNPLYGLLQQNPRYPRSNVSRFDHQLVPHDQTSNLELGFSFSSLELGDSTLVAANHCHNSVPLVSSYPSMFSNAGFTANGDHTIASLLSASLQQQPSFLGFAPYGDEGGSVVDNIQTEMPKNNTDWNNSFSGQNDNDHIKALESSDPASFLWTITGGDGGEWHDPTSNVSVPSLI